MKTTLRIAAATVVAACAPHAAHGQSPDRSGFAQAGVGEGRTRSVAVGVSQSLRDPALLATSHWDFSIEGLLGGWFVNGSGAARGTFVQAGVTPTLRYGFANAQSGPFVELGVGPNVITPHFVTGDRRFSTAFNFGSHFGVGTRFGERGANQLVLRIEHFSNAGIKHPNPGEDFVQLRYARNF